MAARSSCRPEFRKSGKPVAGSCALHLVRQFLDGIEIASVQSVAINRHVRAALFEITGHYVLHPFLHAHPD